MRPVYSPPRLEIDVGEAGASVDKRGPPWTSVVTNMERGHRQAYRTDTPAGVGLRADTYFAGYYLCRRGGQDTVYKHHHTAHSITGIPTASG